MADPLRIGFIGLDTSHVMAFASLLNNPQEKHHVPGGRVVAGFPGGSPDYPSSWDRVDGFTQRLRDDFGVEMFSRPEEVAEAVDMVFIESVDGRVHLDQFRKIAEYGRPTFIDKPLAVTLEDAREIARIAEEAHVPLMSSSSLRYADNLVASLKGQPDNIVGCDAFGPMSLEESQRGLFSYGIHTFEIVATVMGPGCAEVRTTSNEDFDVFAATWGDGRMASIRGNRKGQMQFGVTIHREEDFEFLDLGANDRPWYASLIEAILRSLPKGTPDIPIDWTLELTQIIEAANESGETGKPVRIT